tara:strand:+ start:4726 stop:4899 length:174 start_codon:yes stop_codon:yes gene_type:complete
MEAVMKQSEMYDEYLNPVEEWEAIDMDTVNLGKLVKVGDRLCDYVRDVVARAGRESK